MCSGEIEVGRETERNDREKVNMGGKEKENVGAKNKNASI